MIGMPGMKPLKKKPAVKPEYVMIGDSITHHWGGSLPGTKKHGSGFLGEIIPSAYCDEYGLWI